MAVLNRLLNKDPIDQKKRRSVAKRRERERNAKNMLLRRVTTAGGF